MGPDSMGWGGWMFPWGVPILLALLVAVLCLLFAGAGRDCARDSDQPREGASALEILKKRYASGEIAREEFERIKKDLEA